MELTIGIDEELPSPLGNKIPKNGPNMSILSQQNSEKLINQKSKMVNIEHSGQKIIKKRPKFTIWFQFKGRNTPRMTRKMHF